MRRFRQMSLAIAVVTAFCGAPQRGRAQEERWRGEVKVDGSSTVYLITEAVAANFKKLHPKVKISVGISLHKIEAVLNALEPLPE